MEIARPSEVLIRRLLVLGCVFAALCASAQASACGWGGYSYAGLESSRRTFGIAATVSARSTPLVRAGHVAGWVGVGGYGEASNGGDAWLQVGLAAFEGEAHLRLYYEVTRAGFQPEYRELAATVRPGQRFRLAVLKSRAGRGWWRVWVNGRRASNPIYLPGSDDGWRPVATSESWDGGLDVCNTFAFRFERVAIVTRRNGPWRHPSGFRVWRDPGYRVDTTRTGFSASTK